MRILAVDDHLDNLFLLQSLLQGHNHEVFTARNGEEALNLLAKEQIDLIISDILMPVMDGFTLCREIRKDPNLLHIPFITYTATYTGKKDEDFAREIGSDDFIVKPCEPDELIRRINNFESRIEELKQTHRTCNLAEQEVLKLYNERLIRKLEHKMQETEKEVIAKNQALEALKRSEEILNTTQELSRIGGWEVNIETGEVYWTKELYHLHDLDPDDSKLSSSDLLQISLECFAPEDRALVEQAYAECTKSGKSYSLECKFTSCKGRSMVVLNTAKAMFSGNEVIKVYGSLQDLTEQKQAEEEQNKLRNQLGQVQKLDSIGRLAGGVAHDFNNILTVILGYVEELQGQIDPNDPMYGDVEEIHKAGLRAADLVRQLLTFSRRQTTQPEPMKLNNCLNEIHRMLSRLLGEDIIIELDLDTDLAWIKADLGQIEQVIINLGINAREAMARGGTLKLETRNLMYNDPIFQVFPDLPPADYVMLRATDSGCGMDNDTLEHLFEPFFTTKREANGTGLGLATVYGIVIQSNAQIRVQSQLGKGSSFLIFFPALNTVDIREETVLHNQYTEQCTEHVLVVEDDSGIREMLKTMIAKLGHKVFLVNNAEDALKLVQGSEFRPSLMITDVVMSGIDGIELAQKMRQSLPELKLILMSGYMDRLSEEAEKTLGAVPFLKKPFTKQELEERINQALS